MTNRLLSFVSPLGPFSGGCQAVMRLPEALSHLSLEDNSRRHMWMMVGCSALAVSYCRRENLFHI